MFVETSESEVVSFLFVTYEWSDWRDGLFFWLQSIETQEGHEAALPLLKAALESYASKELGYRYCGLRLCTEKTKSKHFESAVTTFALGESHYYIFHVDTAEPESATTATSQ